MSEANDINQQMHILVIEDEEIVKRLYESFLKKEGHNVDIASTGGEGMEMARQHYYDLLILDLKLPDMDGTEVLKQIQKSGSDMPVVIVTANPSLDSSIEAIRTGSVYEYIVKPFAAKEMQKVIRKAMEKARLRHENKRLIKRLERTNVTLQERVDELEKFAQTADDENNMKALKDRVQKLETELKNSKK